jgi:ubiquinone/menaquinone biosynthesis C-methylase UbiE
MSVKQRVIHRLVRQAHHPTGLGGRATAWMMGHRSSNVRRNRWAVDLLDVQPTDRVLELGCGPGVAIEAFARRVTAGVVVGVDHSEVMIGQARRRNAIALREGRVRLVCTPVERFDFSDGPFDVALAVNSVGFWPDAVERLREIYRHLRPGGQIALVSQPRCPGATAATSASAAQELADKLTDAGFVDVRVDTVELDPPAVCARSRRAENGPSPDATEANRGDVL